MTVKRVMGIETEFGIISPTSDDDSVILTSQIVFAYAGAMREMNEPEGVRWDYSSEQPLHDARGYVMAREEADPSQLTDDPYNLAPSGPKILSKGRQMSQVVRLTELEEKFQRAPNNSMPNGSRMYLDHAHPEYSSPEVLSPRQAVLYDRAGEYIMQRAMVEVEQNKGLPDIVLYKNNVDGKGATYGNHENYMVDRRVPFDDIVQTFIPFFVTRPIICGAGRVGLGPYSEKPGFQISQRADYVENTVGLETTLNRPIVNTRDEPHADGKLFRRFHVIGGDSNVFETSTFIKMASTSLILWVLENYGVPKEWKELELADPVSECSKVSHDTSLTYKLSLADGRKLTAIEIQRVYLDTISKYYEDNADKNDPEYDEETRQALNMWKHILDALENKEFSKLASQVEWVCKKQIMEAMARRENLGWESPKLAAMDLQWADMRLGRGLAYRLIESGKVATLVDKEDISKAEFYPPENTRAYFRGQMIRRFNKDIFSAGWHAMVVDTGEEHMLRVPMFNPLGGTKERVESLFEKSTSVKDIVDALTKK